MRTSPLSYGLLLAVAALPGACSEGGELAPPPPIVDDAGEATADAGPDANDAAASADARDKDAAPPPTCSPGGFCRTELPTDEILYSVWGSPDGSVWAGASRGIYHWDGTAWQVAFSWPAGQSSGVRARILTGTSAEDVWAFGDGPTSGNWRHPAIAHLARRAGTLEWRTVTTNVEIQYGGSGNAWVASPTNLWLAWNYQGVWHVHGEDESGHAAGERELDGQGRPLVDFPFGIWGFDEHRVFVSGYDADERTVFRRRAEDGTWVDVPNPTTLAGSVWSIFGGTRAGDAWLWMHDGTRTRLSGVDANGVLGPPALDRHDWNERPMCGTALASVVRKDWVWTSDGKVVCHYDGTSFRIVPITIDDVPRFKVNGLWSNGPETWVVGEEKPRLPGDISRGFALKLRGAR